MLISLKRRSEDTAYFREVEVTDIRRGSEEGKLNIDFNYDGYRYYALDAEFDENGYTLNIENPLKGSKVE